MGAEASCRHWSPSDGRDDDVPVISDFYFVSDSVAVRGQKAAPDRALCAPAGAQVICR